MKIEDFIGKEIQLFPGDTHFKYAKLLSFDKDSGYVFKITNCSDRAQETVGDIVFYNNSMNVTFKLLEGK